jgi:CheY-like chemotaxis protein
MRGNGRNREMVDHILIVDDDIYWRVSISSILAKYGFRVSTANFGEEALSMIAKAEDRYDLIFVDLEMPGMSGYKLVEVLKKKHINIPVFVVSGFQDKSMFIEMFNKDAARVFIDKKKTMLTPIGSTEDQ